VDLLAGSFLAIVEGFHAIPAEVVTRPRMEMAAEMAGILLRGIGYTEEKGNERCRARGREEVLHARADPRRCVAWGVAAIGRGVSGDRRAFGSGKSTMLNMFGCIDVPSEGSVRIDGPRPSE